MNNELTILLNALNAFGIVGLLAFMVVAFYRAHLVARSLLDRILKLYEEQLSALSEGIGGAADQQKPAATAPASTDKQAPAGKTETPAPPAKAPAK